jgi:hypothetical protein
MSAAHTSMAPRQVHCRGRMLCRRKACGRMTYYALQVPCRFRHYYALPRISTWVLGDFQSRGPQGLWMCNISAGVLTLSSTGVGREVSSVIPAARLQAVSSLSLMACVSLSRESGHSSASLTTPLLTAASSFCGVCACKTSLDDFAPAAAASAPFAAFEPSKEAERRFLGSASLLLSTGDSTVLPLSRWPLDEGGLGGAAADSDVSAAACRL